MNGRLEHDIKVEGIIAKKLTTLPDYVEEWDLNMKASQKTTATRINYLREISKFFAYIKPNLKEVELTDLNTIITQKYFVSLQTKEKNGKIIETSDSYKCMVWACLNSFFSYMVKRNYMTENPILIVDKPRNHDLPRINENRKLLTEKDFNKILKAVDEDMYCDYDYKERNKAILLTFMVTGMRKTALTEINIEDVDMEKYEIKIIDKRKKLHVYPMNDSLYAALEAWIKHREILLRRNNATCDALFISKEMKRLMTYGINDIVTRYSKKGLGYEISPHKLRAGLASILYNKTHDLEFVRRTIGHSDISTTTRYVVTKGKEREEAGAIMDKLLD